MDKLQGENTIVDVFGKDDKYIPIPQKKKTFGKHKPFKRLPRTKWKKTRDKLKASAMYASQTKRFTPQKILVPHKNALQIDFQETRQVIPTVKPIALKSTEPKQPLPEDTSHPLQEEEYKFKNRFDYPLDKRQIEQLKLGLLQKPHDDKLRDITERISTKIEEYTSKRKPKKPITQKHILSPRLIRVQPKEVAKEEEELVKVVEVEEEKATEAEVETIRADLAYLNTEGFGHLSKAEKTETLLGLIAKHELDVPRKSLSSIRKALRDKARLS